MDPVDERVVGRNVITGGSLVGDVDVDAQHLAEQLIRVLRVVLRIVAAAAVAHADVEIAVRAEREMAAVVIGERLRDEALAVDQPRSKRDAVSASSGFAADRLNRATTVWPFGS